MKRATVEWIDSCSYQGWQDPNEPFDPMTIQSIGYVVQEDESKIVLSTSLGANGTYADPIAIPKKCVIQIGRL